ncbi:MAG: 30S ribosomal protein S11 [Patescibacteria group bacterium]|nr:30S ribosomal protein S11 [Patescibacteria group bacterium]MDE2172960.1 30S ribosomal protein S11 [Patescibacteria group bacterium]
MGKKRIVTSGSQEGGDKKAAASAGSSKRRVDAGILHVQSTYNNTKLMLTDKDGNALIWGSAGGAGFRGAKKGTPFAAAKVGETLALRAQNLGMKEVAVVVKGVGSGRESAIRGFISKGILISSIKDATPVPMNGPQPKKPRRV